MAKKRTEQEVNGAIRAVENEILKKETKMKKLTINPEAKGAIKLTIVISIAAALVFAGWTLRGEDNGRITREAQQLVSQLKTKQ